VIYSGFGLPVRETVGARGHGIPTEDAREVEGTVTEALPNALFRIELGDGSLVVAHVSASLRLGTGRILPGDGVRVALSPFDRTRGRIIRRSR
jgi:translation initiation factor IF-1